MGHVLPASLTFATLGAALARDGWREERVPGLLPPLRLGEPEQARFVRGGEALAYSCNPALDLRVVEGPLPAGIPRLGPDEIARLVASRHPAKALLGALAAAEAGLADQRAPILARAARLPPALRPIAMAAARRLDRAGT